jgi:hypothetical protein
LLAFSLKVNEPARAPVVVGENVTPTVQVAPAAMPVPQELLEIAKSPLGVMLENTRAAFWWLVSVTDFAVLVLPTTTVPKLKLLAERVTGATPVPVSAVVCGLLLASSLTVSVAVALPNAEGVNVTPILQLFPAPSVLGLRGQFPPET